MNLFIFPRAINNSGLSQPDRNELDWTQFDWIKPTKRDRKNQTSADETKPAGTSLRPPEQLLFIFYLYTALP